MVRGGGPAGAPGVARPPPWPRASCIPGGGGSASLPGSVTRVPSEISPCHLGPPWRSQECHARGSSLGSSLHSQNVPLLGAQPWVPVMKSGPQPGQVSPLAAQCPRSWGRLASQGPLAARQTRSPVPQGSRTRSTPTDSSACCTLAPLHERRRVSRTPWMISPLQCLPLPECQLSVPYPPGVRDTADQLPRPPHWRLTL